MAQNELRSQVLNRHEKQVDRNIEQHQAISLEQRERGIAVANQNSTIARIVHIIYYAVSVLELLLGVRVILHLLGADPASAFGSLIDGLSYPFVALFANLVQNPLLGTTGVLEVTTLIAMLVWAIFTWLVGRVFWLLLSRPR